MLKMLKKNAQEKSTKLEHRSCWGHPWQNTQTIWFNCISSDYVLKECEPVSSATALTLEHLMLQINALEIDM